MTIAKIGVNNNLSLNRKYCAAGCVPAIRQVTTMSFKAEQASKCNEVLTCSITCTCFLDIFQLTQVTHNAPHPAVSKVSYVKDSHIELAGVKQLSHKMAAKKA